MPVDVTICMWCRREKIGSETRIGPEGTEEMYGIYAHGPAREWPEGTRISHGLCVECDCEHYGADETEGK
jgi:hypothetical protein